MVIRVKQGLSLLCSSHRVYREAGYIFQFEPESELERACFLSKWQGEGTGVNVFMVGASSLALLHSSLHHFIRQLKGSQTTDRCRSLSHGVRSATLDKARFCTEIVIPGLLWPCGHERQREGSAEQNGAEDAVFTYQNKSFQVWAKS